jgi:ligand-binding SRPBCC domain-containing protein
VPRFTITQVFPLPVAELFARFRRPAEVVRLAPPEAGLRLLEAPEVVEVGSRIAVQARRWGLTRRVVTEVVELIDGARIVEEQREGPFQRWVHVRRFAPAGAGCAVTEEIDYEPPGGVLGRLLTAEVIDRELRSAYAGREGRLC